MRRILFLILLALSYVAVADSATFCQDAKDLGRLHDFLSLPGTAVLGQTNRTGLPTTRPLKIYLATDDEPTAPAEVEKFITEQNRRAAAQAAIKIVSSMAQADVILVQFEAREKRRIELDNRLTMDPTLSTRTSGGSSNSVYRSEIRGYVIVHEGDKYRIVDSYKRSVTLGVKRTELRAAFERALKQSHGS
jgi:hypothetical protein